MAHRDTLPAVAERIISLRLDDESEAALRLLTTRGVSRSKAIRSAIVEAARERRMLIDEARMVREDPADRAEMARVRELMESLRDPW